MQQLTFVEPSRLEWQDVEAPADPRRGDRAAARGRDLRPRQAILAGDALLEHFGKLVMTR